MPVAVTMSVAASVAVTMTAVASMAEMAAPPYIRWSAIGMPYF